eukprot:6769637-Heterocapsa_arctica.AAC.1
MPAGFTVCVGCCSPFIFEDINVTSDVPLRCAGPSRFAAPAVAGTGVAGASDAPTLMGPGASSSSNVDPYAVQRFSPEQVAAAE